jgi:hypothetical protein
MPHDPIRVADTQGWLRRANRDLSAAAHVRRVEPPLLDVAVFHCQQAAEKSMKALLTWALRESHAGIDEFVLRALHLQLKAHATILAPVSQGLPFLGWRIHRGTTRLRPQNARRSRRRLVHRAWELRRGRIAAERYLAAVRSVLTHVGQGHTLALRQAWLSTSLAAEHELGSGFQAPRTASTAAAASTTPPRTRARRTATTTRRRTGTTTSASAPPRHSSARSPRPRRCAAHRDAQIRFPRRGPARAAESSRSDRPQGAPGSSPVRGAARLDGGAYRAKMRSMRAAISLNRSRPPPGISAVPQPA